MVDVRDRRRPWTLHDAHYAEEIWEKLSDDARSFLRILMASPEKEFTAEEIGQILEPSREARKVQGLLGRAGQLCIRAGLEQLWHFPKKRGRTRYSMARTVANLLRDADGAGRTAPRGSADGDRRLP
jgi:hypothetical protein